MTLAQIRPVRGRVLFSYFVLSLIASSVVFYALPGWFEWSPSAQLSVALSLTVWYLLLSLLLIRVTARSGQSLRGLFGPRPASRDIGWAVVMGFALLGISIGIAYAVFLPLSYVAPDFVQWWLFEDQFILIATSGEYFRIANVLTLALLILVAPLVEEIFRHFRRAAS